MNKKLFSGITALVITGALATSVYAATTTSDLPFIGRSGYFKIENTENMTDEEKAELRTRIKLDGDMTEEEIAELEASIESKRAEMQAKLEEQKAKWDALSDEQKEELYALQEAAINNQIDILKKQLEFGLADEESTNDRIESLEEAKANLRTNSEGSMFFSITHDIRIKDGKDEAKATRVTVSDQSDINFF